MKQLLFFRATRFPNMLLPLFFLIIAGCSSQTIQESAPDAIADTARDNTVATADAFTTPVKPDIDDRDYRYFSLDNGLRVLIISDADTDTAAAALAVEVGSFHNPADRAGLAHFLEHMLSMGTEKYPDPDEFQAFIKRHGGQSNAYTSSDYTNYMFSIAAPQFGASLDRFAQFFITPLFSAEYVDREKNAVDSEYQFRIRDESRRTSETRKLTFNPQHPATGFSVGNLDTLADREGSSVRDEMIGFYKDHYSAHRMTLVMLGSEDLDTLATYAKALFTEIPRREVATQEPQVPLFRSDDLPGLLHIKPLQDRRVLEFFFPLPGIDSLYHKNPVGYISNLIGHEGQGSLYARLRAEGWIDSLASGAGSWDGRNSVLSVAMELTESGLANWPQIGELLFAYIETLQAEGINAAQFDEARSLADLAFRYREQSEPFGYVRSLASSLLVYSPADVLRGGSAMQDYDPVLIQDFAARLNPDNVLVTLIAPDLATTALEPLYQVEYAQLPLQDKILQQWRDPGKDPALHMPAANPFIPDNLALVNNEGEQPKQLANVPSIELWHLADTKFQIPRAQVRIELRTSRVGASAADVVHAGLYTQLVTDTLNAYAYPARLAGLGYSLSADGTALNLGVGGYSDKLDKLLTRVLTALRDLVISPERFEHYHNELLKDLRNAPKQPPNSQAFAEARRLLNSPNYPLAALTQATETTTLASLQTWTQTALAEPETVMFVHGNMTADKARALASSVAQTLSLPAETPSAPTARLTKLGDDSRIRRQVNVEHEDAVLVMYVQGRNQSWEERARFGLLARLISSPYFTALRTEQQLGYVVGSLPWISQNTPGMAFYVQSPVASPADIEAANWAFFENFKNTLATMSETQFAAARAGLMNQLLEEDKNLAERTGRFWSDLNNGITSFDSRQRIADTLTQLQLVNMQTFYKEFLTLTQTRRAQVWTNGRFALPEAAPSGKEIDDTEAFKAANDSFIASGAKGADRQAKQAAMSVD